MTIQKLEGLGPPVDDALLDRLEARFGFALPPEYRAFLLRNNGGRPSPGHFIFRPGYRDDSDGLQKFFPIGHPDWKPVTDEDGEVDWGPETVITEREMMRGRVPDELLVIATADGGLVGIGITGKWYGKIYYWDRINESQSESTRWGPRWGNIWQMAENLDEFLEGLHEFNPHRRRPERVGPPEQRRPGYRGIGRFENAAPPVDEAELRRIERKYGIVLPPQYRAFLLHTNGGQPEPEWAFRFGPGEGDVANEFVFFSVGKAVIDPLIFKIQPDLLPIGRGWVVGRVGIGIEPHNFGAVYRHIESSGGCEDQSFKVADSFDEFLDLFYDNRMGEA